MYTVCACVCLYTCTDECCVGMCVNAEGIDSAKLRNLSSFCVSARDSKCFYVKTSTAWERSEVRTDGDNGEKEVARDGNLNCVYKKFT